MKTLKKIFQGLLKMLPVTAIVLTWYLLLINNFVPDTWLSGWDNLHPEFNLSLNIGRSLNAAWQEYQGTGLVGGMAHAADLPRQVILFLASFVLPTQLLRYFWVFLMLLIGPLGIYFLVRDVLIEGKKTTKNMAGLVASLFYLLNLATVQYFFTPFETFVSFYGFFPWLLYFALKYLKLGKKKNLLHFFIVSLLATPAFYVQTLFIVYLIVLAIFALEIIVKKRMTGLIRGLKLGLSVFATNAFWLLPVIYFSLTNTQVVQQSKINSIATVETQAMNEAAGSGKDIAGLKGFWFNYMDLSEDNTFDYLYKDWIDYANSNPLTETNTYILFSLSLGGLLGGLFFKKNVWKFSGLLTFVFSYFMLASTNPPLDHLFRIVSEKIPLFLEIFRSVFTKWSIVMAFVYCLGLAYLVSFLAKISKKVIFPVFVVAILIVQMVVSVKPSFEGNLISNTMKVEIPKQYFEVFDYFEKQPKEARIAFLPAQTFWGWNFYDWGYRGSGFLWYGIEQPMLDRAFDVWSANNESFYNQLSEAIYSKDLISFENTLRKFQVTYLILDESITMSGNSDEFLYESEIRDLISQSEHIRLEKSLSLLDIFRIDYQYGNQYVWTPKEFVLADVDLTYSSTDIVYDKYGDYVFDKEGITIPFANFDYRKGPEVVFDGNKVKIQSEKLVFNGEKQLNIPEQFESDLSTLRINEEKQMEVVLEMDRESKNYVSRGLSEIRNCNLKTEGEVYREIEGNKVTYRAGNNAVTCDFYNYPELELTQGYFLKIKGENLEGRSLKIYLQNWNNNKIDFETLLPRGEFNEVFFISPKEVGGTGYTLNLETRAFGKISATNVIEEIQFIPVPTIALQGIELVSEGYSNAAKDMVIIDSKKVGTGYYSVETNSKEGLIVLGQGYESGWLGFGFEEDNLSVFNKAFPWFMGDILKHTRVNSWANGWFVPEDNQKLIIVFWPQYLEYFGMTIMVLGLVFLINKKDKTHLIVDKDRRRKLK